MSRANSSTELLAIRLAGAQSYSELLNSQSQGQIDDLDRNLLLGSPSLGDSNPNEKQARHAHIQSPGSILSEDLSLIVANDAEDNNTNSGHDEMIEGLLAEEKRRREQTGTAVDILAANFDTSRQLDNDFDRVSTSRYSKYSSGTTPKQSQLIAFESALSPSNKYRIKIDSYRRKVIEQQNELRSKDIKQSIINERATLLESSLSSALDSLRNVKSLKTELELTNERLQAAAGEKQNLVDQLRARVQRMTKREEELVDLLKNKDEKLNTLSSEANSAKRQLSQSNQSVEQHRVLAENTHTRLNATIKKLKQQLEAKDRELEEALHSIQELSDKVERTKAEWRFAETQHANLVSTKEERINTLEADIKSMRERMSKNLTEEQQSTKQVEESLKESRQETREMRKQLTESQANERLLTSQLNQKEKEHDKELRMLTEKVHHSEQLCQELQSNLSERSSVYTMTEKRRLEFQHQCDLLQVQKEQISERLSETKQNLASSMSENSMLIEQVKQLQVDLASSKADSKELSRKNAELETQIEGYVEKLEKSATEQAVIQNQLVLAEEKKIKAESETAHQIRMLELKLSEANDVHAANEQQLKTRLDQLREQLAQSEQDRALANNNSRHTQQLAEREVALDRRMEEMRQMLENLPTAVLQKQRDFVSRRARQLDVVGNAQLGMDDKVPTLVENDGLNLDPTYSHAVDIASKRMRKSISLEFERLENAFANQLNKLPNIVRAQLLDDEHKAKLKRDQAAFNLKTELMEQLHAKVLSRVSEDLISMQTSLSDDIRGVQIQVGEELRNVKIQSNKVEEQVTAIREAEMKNSAELFNIVKRELNVVQESVTNELQQQNVSVKKLEAGIVDHEQFRTEARVAWEEILRKADEREDHDNNQSILNGELIEQVSSIMGGVADLTDSLAIVRQQENANKAAANRPVLAAIAQLQDSSIAAIRSTDSLNTTVTDLLGKMDEELRLCRTDIREVPQAVDHLLQPVMNRVQHIKAELTEEQGGLSILGQNISRMNERNAKEHSRVRDEMSNLIKTIQGNMEKALQKVGADGQGLVIDAIKTDMKLLFDRFSTTLPVQINDQIRDNMQTFEHTLSQAIARSADEVIHQNKEIHNLSTKEIGAMFAELKAHMDRLQQTVPSQLGRCVEIMQGITASVGRIEGMRTSVEQMSHDLRDLAGQGMTSQTLELKEAIHKVPQLIGGVLTGLDESQAKLGPQLTTILSVLRDGVDHRNRLYKLLDQLSSRGQQQTQASSELLAQINRTTQSVDGLSDLVVANARGLTEVQTCMDNFTKATDFTSVVETQLKVKNELEKLPDFISSVLINLRNKVGQSITEIEVVKEDIEKLAALLKTQDGARELSMHEDVKGLADLCNTIRDDLNDRFAALSRQVATDMKGVGEINVSLARLNEEQTHETTTTRAMIREILSENARNMGDLIPSKVQQALAPSNAQLIERLAIIERDIVEVTESTVRRGTDIESIRQIQEKSLTTANQVSELTQAVAEMTTRMGVYRGQQEQDDDSFRRELKEALCDMVEKITANANLLDILKHSVSAMNQQLATTHLNDGVDASSQRVIESIRSEVVSLNDRLRSMPEVLESVRREFSESMSSLPSFISSVMTKMGDKVSITMEDVQSIKEQTSIQAQTLKPRLTELKQEINSIRQKIDTMRTADGQPLASIENIRNFLSDYKMLAHRAQNLHSQSTDEEKATLVMTADALSYIKSTLNQLTTNVSSSKEQQNRMLYTLTEKSNSTAVELKQVLNSIEYTKTGLDRIDTEVAQLSHTCQAQHNSVHKELKTLSNGLHDKIRNIATNTSQHDNSAQYTRKLDQMLETIPAKVTQKLEQSLTRVNDEHRSQITHSVEGLKQWMEVKAKETAARESTQSMIASSLSQTQNEDKQRVSEQLDNLANKMGSALSILDTVEKGQAAIAQRIASEEDIKSIASSIEQSHSQLAKSLSIPVQESVEIVTKLGKEIASHNQKEQLRKDQNEEYEMEFKQELKEALADLMEEIKKISTGSNKDGESNLALNSSIQQVLKLMISLKKNKDQEIKQLQNAIDRVPLQLEGSLQVLLNQVIAGQGGLSLNSSLAPSSSVVAEELDSKIKNELSSIAEQINYVLEAIVFAFPNTSTQIAGKIYRMVHVDILKACESCLNNFENLAEDVKGKEGSASIAAASTLVQQSLVELEHVATLLVRLQALHGEVVNRDLSSDSNSDIWEILTRPKVKDAIINLVQKVEESINRFTIFSSMLEGGNDQAPESDFGTLKVLVLRQKVSTCVEFVKQLASLIGPQLSLEECLSDKKELDQTVLSRVIGKSCTELEVVTSAAQSMLQIYIQGQQAHADKTSGNLEAFATILSGLRGQVSSSVADLRGICSSLERLQVSLESQTLNTPLHHESPMNVLSSVVQQIQNTLTDYNKLKSDLTERFSVTESSSFNSVQYDL